LRLAEADLDHVAPAEVPDRLAALALHLGHVVVAERCEQIAVEGQAALDRRDDEIDVVDASARGHVPPRTFRGRGPSPASAAIPAASGV